MKRKQAMTLDRVLSRFGIASRTEALRIIREGRVKVRGTVVRDPAVWVQPASEPVHLDGRRLRPSRRIYLLLYKPKGVITSHGDPEGRKTVYDLLGDGYRWVVPVGRLDRDTSGLLLLTNDTDFADFITAPVSGIRKTYRVKLDRIADEETIERLAAGIRLTRGDHARPESVRRLEDRGKHTWLEIVLTEGKNREVRRMIEAAGMRVLKLVRTAIGRLTLEGLEIGKYRELSAAEVGSLRRRE